MREGGSRGWKKGLVKEIYMYEEKVEQRFEGTNVAVTIPGHPKCPKDSGDIHSCTMTSLNEPIGLFNYRLII